MSVASLNLASRATGETDRPALTTSPGNGLHGCRDTAQPILTIGEGGDEVAELVERVASLEVEVRYIKEGNERQEIKLDHLSNKMDFHREETDEKLNKILTGIAVKDAADKVQKRTLVIVSGGVMSALTFIGGMIWTYGAVLGKAFMGFLAALPR